MEIQCNKENWQSVCHQLKLRRDAIIYEYDDYCFYMALARNDKAIDLVFWRCISENQRLLADFLDQLLEHDSEDDDLNVDFGFCDYTNLQERIATKTIAHDMECEYDYTRFEIIELKSEQFPYINPKCMHQSYADGQNTYYINENTIRYTITRADYLKCAIDEIFKLILEHNENCKEIGSTQEE
jgi:hypothetical protein